MLNTKVRVELWFTLTFEQSVRENVGIPFQLADDEDLDPQGAVTQSKVSVLQLL